MPRTTASWRRIFPPETNRSFEPTATDIVAFKTGNSQPRRRRGWLDFGPAIALLFATSMGLLPATFSPSGDRGQYAVFAPPWYNFARTADLVRAAGGEIIDFGGSANVVITHSDGPDYTMRLYRAGAWFVMDPSRLRGCLGVVSTGGVV